MALRLRVPLREISTAANELLETAAKEEVVHVVRLIRSWGLGSLERRPSGTKARKGNFIDI